MRPAPAMNRVLTRCGTAVMDGGHAETGGGMLLGALP